MAFSTRSLKAMNRHYNRQQYLELVDYARKVMPELVLTSDVIVGFPGETEAEFEETVTLIRQVRYDAPGPVPRRPACRTLPPGRRKTSGLTGSAPLRMPFRKKSTGLM